MDDVHLNTAKNCVNYKSVNRMIRENVWRSDNMEFNTQDMKRISEIARKMKGKSEDQIIKELSHMIRAGEGGLTPEKAESMFKMICLF